MSILRPSLPILSALLISSCSLATPFRGPGYQADIGVTKSNQDNVMVGLTHVVLHKDKTSHPVFWDYVDRVEASLSEQPGFIGYSKRTQLFGNEAWTMTVWTNEKSMENFVKSKAHKKAMRRGMDAIEESRFARFTIKAKEIPLSWEDALQHLNKYARDG